MKSCKEHGRRVCWSCLLATVGFPLEHWVWTYTPGLRAVTGMLGL